MAYNYGLRPTTTQKVTISGTSAATSNAFATGAMFVRLVSTTDCHVEFAGTPTATTSSLYLPAEEIEIFKVSPGQKVAGIQATGGGHLYVTEMCG